MKQFLVVGVIVAVAVGFLGGCNEQGMKKGDIDPVADKMLKDMSDTLAGSKDISVKAVIIAQEPAGTGQMVQLHERCKVVFCRPDRLFVEKCRGEDTWRLWHKGKNLTIASPASFASCEAPADVRKMADKVEADYQTELPMADLLSPNPYKELTGNITTGRYLGDHKVDGVKCAHLLFTQDNIDWQIWIERGPTPVPRKMVIDYKKRPGRPQFTTIMSDWNLAAKADEKMFEPGAFPSHYIKVEMVDLFGVRNSNK